MSTKRKKNEQGQNASQEFADITGNAELKRKASELVRYLLCQDKRKVPIKRQDINKNVMKEHVKSFQPIFEDARSCLNHIFGIDVIEHESSNKSKVYLLTNMLVAQNDIISSESQNIKNFGLLMIILSLIYMSSGVLSDDLLKRTLKKLGMQSDSGHSERGDASKSIQDFVKQGYIIKEKVAGAEGVSYRYKLGVRSQTETTKRKILEFISEVYGVEISQWKMQYKDILSEESEAT